MKIEPSDIELMHELMDIQQARAANWPTVHAPADSELEARHADRLAAIQQTLSANRAHAEGTSEAPAGQDCNRGVVPVPAGNLFRRFFQRFTR